LDIASSKRRCMPDTGIDYITLHLPCNVFIRQN
jgi:hypothetical protein